MTATGTADRFLVLHALRIKGLAGAAALAEATGLDTAAAEGIATELTRQELARHRDGRMSGYSLTADGKNAHVELLTGEVDDPDTQAALSTAYERFLPINNRFKQVCTDWQMKPGGDESDEPVPNDHTDPDYDTAVTDELAAVHGDVAPVLDALAGTLSRFGRYRERLRSALDRVRSGETQALAKPMANSYHDIWMELHQDLLTSAQRERSAQDES